MKEPLIKDGYYKLYGIYNAMIDHEDKYGVYGSDEHKTKVNATYIKLDDKCYIFKEDPDDGYRSHCDIEIVNPPSDAVFNLAHHPVLVYVKYGQFLNEEESYKDLKGLRLYTDETLNMCLGSFGTENFNDYYPCFHCYLDIPAINTHIAEQHLLD